MNHEPSKFNLKNESVEHDFNYYDHQSLFEFMAMNDEAHAHNYYILSFLDEGSVSHLSDFDHKRISAPAILLLDIHQVHTHPELNNCKIRSIAFSTEFIGDQNSEFFDMLYKTFSHQFIKLSQAELQSLDVMLNLIKQQFLQKKNCILLKALLNVLLVQCGLIAENAIRRTENADEVYSKFRALIIENVRHHHDVSFYIDSLNVSVNVLNQKVKLSAQITPKQLIDEHLLVESKRLLYWSNLTVRELSWKLGFETDSYFNRFFKKHTGITPKRFHNQARLAKIQQKTTDDLINHQ